MPNATATTTVRAVTLMMIACRCQSTTAQVLTHHGCRNPM